MRQRRYKWRMFIKLCAGLCLCFSIARAGSEYFGIRIVDEETGEGVPLAEIRTVNEVTLVSDNAGWVAFQEPGLMEREAFFHVASPGYEKEKDGFGFRGVRLVPKRGDSATVKIRRVNVAERVGRLTGGGLFRDSELLGKPVPIPNASPVLGQDSVQSARYDGRIFLLWGDTNVARYPLGNFRTTAATIPVEAHPSNGLRYAYFMDGTALRKMLPLDGPGAVWMFGLHAIRGEDGREVLLSGFGLHPSLGERTRHGVARFDNEKGVFVVASELEKNEEWRYPRGVAVQHEGYVYFASPLAHTRVAAKFADVTNPARYEAYWLDPATKKWSWQREHAPTTETLITAGGKELRIHTASVKWNAWRKRWILVGLQSGGKSDPSPLGEVWYAESAAPEGPWGRAVKIATHPRYSFYNPVHHDFFDTEGGKVIWFEGTYTREFSGNPAPTPRYDYNQLMYRLDLADPRLVPAR